MAARSCQGSSRIPLGNTGSMACVALCTVQTFTIFHILCNVSIQSLPVDSIPC